MKEKPQAASGPGLRRSGAKLFKLDQGRVPPQAVEFEQAVLGAMLIDNTAVGEVLDILSPESFYREGHGLIYGAIRELFGDSQPVDILTVGNALRQKGQLPAVGGDYYLVELSQKVSSAAHCEFHARVIMQKYLQRELIRVAGDMIQKAFDETTDVFELLDQSEQDLFDVAHKNVTKGYDEAKELVHEAIERIKEISTKQGLSGIPSGFNGIDNVTAGWQASDLIILAARPGMGKTAFVLSMARNITVDHRRPVAIFSLEMPSVQLITRMISSETGISADKLRKGNLDEAEWTQLVSKVRTLESAPLYIDDTPALSVFDLRAKCRRLVTQRKIELVIIDYLQLMTIGGQKQAGNREQEISTISRSLKSIAKELGIPVIALSQLSRAVETRGGDKRPILSDLRESGAIEQDADIVSFIYRPDYYQLTEWPDGEPCEGQAEFIIAKHRNGSLDDVRLRFQGRMAKFSDLNDPENDGGSMVIESKMNNDAFLDDGPADNNSHDEDDDDDAFGPNRPDPNDMPF